LLEKLLTRDAKFIWNNGCEEAFDLLKEKLIPTKTLAFLDWTKLFVVHVDALEITINALFMHPR